MANTDTQSILVVGSGMSGLTAAIEAAEAGYDVYIVEKNPYLGGGWPSFIITFLNCAPPIADWKSTFAGSGRIPGYGFLPWLK